MANSDSSGSPQRAVWKWSLVLLFSAQACAEAHRDRVSEPPPAPTSFATTPDTSVNGQLSGRPFALRSARYYVDQRPGYERVDVLLYDLDTDTPCEDIRPHKPASVWLRSQGKKKIVEGQYRLDAKTKAPWEVHYQVFQDGAWRGSRKANALLAFKKLQPDLKLEGELNACFADSTTSCIAGTFVAHYCRISIDAPVRGSETMEQPVSRRSEPPPAESAPGSDRIAVEPRQQLLPTYPCSSCHERLEPRPQKRKLSAFHVVRNDDFSHGEDAFWCYQCHSLKNIDRLRTATGELVSFNEAYRICTSCHGDKLKDWRDGLHGLILGDYNGVKHKKSCPACHDPHDPTFPRMKPQRPPAPARQWSTL